MMSGDFALEVGRRLGQKVAVCYQCGKCTAGCPMVWDMDLAPNQVVHAVQMGERELALGCKTIWVCAACETCSTRCPKEFDIARLMNVLREMSLEARIMHPDVSDIIDFHLSFLDSVKRHGRTFEPEMIADYKFRSGHLLQDVINAVGMLRRGKLRLLPHTIRGARSVRRIFRECRDRRSP